MVIFYLILFILIFSCLKFCKIGYNEDYLSFDATNAIKGIFILLVFIKHVTPYITSAGYTYTSIGDNVFRLIDTQVGQWIVAMFLFYSGYGIMESIKKKGKDYISSIPRKRLLTVLMNFDVAVLIYICIYYSLSGGVNLELNKLVLSFIAWESMGNSNWYIFVIMLAYTFTYFSFKFFNTKRNDYKIPCVVSMGALFVAMIILSYLKESWWYDTILCFGAGTLFSNYKEQIETMVKRNYCFIVIVLLVLLFLFSNAPVWLKGLRYNLFSIVFCFLIMLGTMKIKVNSKALTWLGQNLFPLYIYQRIPMIILSSIGGGVFVLDFPILYVISCLVITIMIAFFYKYWSIKL